MQTHCVHGSFLKSKYLIKICKIYVVKFPGLIAIIYTSQQKKRYNIFYIWFCLRIRPTTGRLTRSPDSRNLLQTFYSKFGRLLDQIF
jgi:hypothetical protein